MDGEDQPVALTGTEEVEQLPEDVELHAEEGEQPDNLEQAVEVEPPAIHGIEEQEQVEAMQAVEEEPQDTQENQEEALQAVEEVPAEQPVEEVVAVESEPVEAEPESFEAVEVEQQEAAPEAVEEVAPEAVEEIAQAGQPFASEIPTSNDGASTEPEAAQPAEEEPPVEAISAEKVEPVQPQLQEKEESPKVVINAQPEKAEPERAQVEAPQAVPQPQPELRAPERQPTSNAGIGGVPPRPHSKHQGKAPASRQPQYEEYEEDVAALLVGDMMPAQFRRGFDNSHINRMSQGSYSRYLLSSDIIPGEKLYASFLGDTPVPGFLPFRGEHTADLETRRGNTRASSQRANRNNQPGRYPGDNLSSTMGATMSSTLRREMEMLDEPMYNELGAQRSRRRRDPEHCVDPKVTDQHYYNEKSKAYFVPQDQNPDAAMLQYNHLYDFGDGSRFKSSPGEKARRNPTATPPRTYAENRQAAAAIQHPRQPTKATGSVANKRREEIEKGSSSLRTAKAVDVQKLHCSQFRQTRSIEDVVASDPTYVARSTDGIRSVVDSGKMDWSELPNRLQNVMSAERYKKRPNSSGRLYAPYRPPPQPSPNSVPSGTTTDGTLPPVGSKNSYEVSRISFTKRYEPNATPSAFVDKKGELEPL